MCRIAGIKSKNKEKHLVAMRDVLSHGGPDAANVYYSPDELVALGHRRLSILDLSKAGTQPMQWEDWVICYNGEVYNFEEIKAKMPDYQFVTGTDTEVIIKAFDKWGYDAVTHFRGMFAFALYNTKTKKLTLCRDRVGVKPLYWYQKNDLFMFASELKAFHENPEFDKSINHSAVSLFLQQGYIPAPNCIFKYAHKLEPGHFLEIDANNEIKKIKYWDAKESYESPASRSSNEGELIEEAEALLKDSFKLRMVADVPVGMFLSGGIDSSLVTAILQKETNSQVKTFTIGFDDPNLNEAKFAKSISQHLGTDHTELYCSEKDFISIIPKLPEIYDEPFGDSSGIPTYLVSQLAKEQVKVSLSADGGDELFGGYTKYEVSKNYFNKIGKIPHGIRKLSKNLLDSMDPIWLEKNSASLPVLKNYKGVGNKFYKFRKAFDAKDITSFFNIASTYLSESELEKIHPHFTHRFVKNGESIHPERLISYFGMIDIKSYLEGDIMTKVDRATMQVALEGREPFLDHHLIEFAQSLPDNLKIKDESTKYLLRQILFKYVPRELIERPKMGFSIPAEKWLRTLLSDQLRSIESDHEFFATFELNKEEVSKMITSFLNNSEYVNPHVVWFIYTLHQWYHRWLR